MQQLEFSPISEKEEESMETISFVNARHDHEPESGTALEERSLNTITKSVCGKQRLHLDHVKTFYIKLGSQKLAAQIMQIRKQRYCHTFAKFKQIHKQLHSVGKECDLSNKKQHLMIIRDKIQSAVGGLYEQNTRLAFKQMKAILRRKKQYLDVGNIAQLVGSFNLVWKRLKHERLELCYSDLKQLPPKINKIVSQFVTPEKKRQDQRQQTILNKSANVSEWEIKSTKNSKFLLEDQCATTRKLSDSRKHSNSEMAGQLSLQYLRQRSNHQKLAFNKTKRLAEHTASQMQASSEKKVATENIIIIHSTHSKRKPDGEFRLPLSGDDVNIIELRSQRKKKHSDNKKGKSNQIFVDLPGMLKDKQIQSYNIPSSRRPSSSSSYSSASYREMKSRSHISQSIENSHICDNCKFCQTVKEMESYRINRLTHITHSRLREKSGYN